MGQRISASMVKKSQATNEEYVQLLRTESGRSKASALHSAQMTNYIRENCIFDKIMTPEEISPSDCEVGIETDTLFKRVWFTPETRAFWSSFEGTPTQVQELFAPRILVGFYRMQSATIVANNYNVSVYPFPIVKQMEDLIGPALHEAVDWVMLDRLEQTIQAANPFYGNILRGAAAQADINGVGVNTHKRFPVERADITRLKKFYAGTRAKVRVFLMTDEDYIDFERLRAEDFGDQRVQDVFVNGLDVQTIHGVPVVRTIKSDFSRGDLLRSGNMYAFPDEDMIGSSFLLQGIDFWVDRERQYLKFDASTARGFSWTIASRTCKVELYNGGLDTAGAGLGVFGTAPVTSDALWGDPSEVTFKDYYDIHLGLNRPNFTFS